MLHPLAVPQELGSVLEELKAKATAAHTLLVHIYTAHPPANPEHNLEETPNADNSKRLLKQAILHYHPDKAMQERCTRKEVVLREEIVKALNSKYEFFK